MSIINYANCLQQQCKFLWDLKVENFKRINTYYINVQLYLSNTQKNIKQKKSNALHGAIISTEMRPFVLKCTFFCFRFKEMSDLKSFFFSHSFHFNRIIVSAQIRKSDLTKTTQSLWTQAMFTLDRNKKMTRLIPKRKEKKIQLIILHKKKKREIEIEMNINNFRLKKLPIKNPKLKKTFIDGES